MTTMTTTTTKSMTTTNITTLRPGRPPPRPQPRAAGDLEETRRRPPTIRRLGETARRTQEVTQRHEEVQQETTKTLWQWRIHAFSHILGDFRDSEFSKPNGGPGIGIYNESGSPGKCLRWTVCNRQSAEAMHRASGSHVPWNVS